MPDRELTYISDRLVQGAGIVTGGEEAKEEGSSFQSVYYHQGCELYAENVELYLAVLPEVVTSSMDITIDDILVRDPGVPLTEDQKSL